MIKVSVERTGINFNVFASKLHSEILPVIIARLAERTEDVMREKAPYRTGALMRSIQKHVMGLEARIGPTVPYALYVEYGTRPHEILPVFAKALRFEVGGNVVFAARVWHPGTRPQPFVRETADKIKTEIPRFAKNVLQEAIK